MQSSSESSAFPPGYLYLELKSLTVFSSSIKELGEKRKGKMTILNCKLVLRKVKKWRTRYIGTSRMPRGRSTTLANPRDTTFTVSRPDC